MPASAHKRRNHTVFSPVPAPKCLVLLASDAEVHPHLFAGIFRPPTVTTVANENISKSCVSIGLFPGGVCGGVGVGMSGWVCLASIPRLLPGSPGVSLAGCTAVLSSLSSPTGSFCWLGKCPKMASHSCAPGQQSRPELVIISPTCKPWTYQSIFSLINRYPHPS